MYCKRCGHSNIEEAIFCSHCGASLRDESMPKNNDRKINVDKETYSNNGEPVNDFSKESEDRQIIEVPIVDYSLPALVLTLLCCPPFGLAALMYSGRANKNIRLGKIDEAEENARKAKMWCIITFVSGVVCLLLGAGIQFGLEFLKALGKN